MNTTKTPLLLIVDDSRMSRMLIRAVVAESRPDWQILEAANGDEAIQLANENQPNFVSMDVNMPGMNGLEAAARILIRNPKMRIVMCTANIQESTREATSKIGLHFVAKPITTASFASAITFFEA